MKLKALKDFRFDGRPVKKDGQFFAHEKYSGILRALKMAVPDDSDDVVIPTTEKIKDDVPRKKRQYKRRDMKADD